MLSHRRKFHSAGRSPGASSPLGLSPLVGVPSPGSHPCAAVQSILDRRAERLGGWLQRHFLDVLLPFSSVSLCLPYLVSGFPAWHPLVLGADSWLGEMPPFSLPSSASVSVLLIMAATVSSHVLCVVRSSPT